MVRPAPLPPPREDAQRHQEEELASFSSPETTRTTRNIFGSNATGEEDNNNNVNIQCRFCFGSDDMSEMISPCDCWGKRGLRPREMFETLAVGEFTKQREHGNEMSRVPSDV